MFQLYNPHYMDFHDEQNNVLSNTDFHNDESIWFDYLNIALPFKLSLFAFLDTCRIADLISTTSQVAIFHESGTFSIGKIIRHPTSISYVTTIGK